MHTQAPTFWSPIPLGLGEIELPVFQENNQGRDHVLPERRIRREGRTRGPRLESTWEVQPPLATPGRDSCSKPPPPFLSGQMSLHTPSLRLPDDHRIKTPRIKFPPSSHTISKNREERCLAGKKKCAWNSYRPKAFEHSQRPQMCPQRGPPVSPSAAWRKTSQLAFSSWSCPSG